VVVLVDSQLRLLYQERSSHNDTLGILLIQKKEMLSPVTDGFDSILLVVNQNVQEQWYVNHYHYDNKKVQVISVNKNELNQWLAAGSNRRAVEWVLYGKVLFDRNEYIASLKNRLEAFPYELRKKKMCVEFARLIRRYQEGKELLRSGDHLDAFNQILHALHHWARLSVIENGYHPEVTLWRQVKNIDPEIHKLYDELIMGSESLDKKIELLLIASEFSLMSKTRIAAAHLIEIMSLKEEAWLFQELLLHADVKEYSLDLGILLEHLLKKHIIDEVYVHDMGGELQSRAYRLSN
jgi:hypothetical protein